MTNPGPAARPALSPLRTILLGGLAIGTIDILWAIIMTLIKDGSPVTVLQSIAGGLLGKSAYEGGAGTAVMGLALHYCIATCVMTVYYLASRKLPALAPKPWVFGPLYGIVVYAVMYQLVLPLSALHGRGIQLGVPLIKGLFIHLFGIGLVAGLVTRRGTAKD